MSRTKTKLNKTELKKFKKFYESKKEELLISLDNNLKQELDVDGDDVDFVQGQVLSEVATKLSRRDIETLKKINVSLEKIDNGNFGLCESCDELINQKRLFAVLGCSSCVLCAEQKELSAKQYGVNT